MSHPFRFNQEEGRSPLDRQPPNLFTSGQPPSFKTNVNRMKTKKWVEAKANTYDGGDWGDYDEYDEYGTEQEPQPPSISTGPTGLRQKGQTAAEPSRSFTDPQRFPPPQVGRRHSFEAGDEQRAFFSANPQSGNHREHGNLHAPDSNPPEPAIYAAPQPQQPYIPQPQISTSEPSPAPDYMTNRRPSGAASDISDTPQNRRDFSPSALPPPLSTRMSPAPGSGNASPAGHRFPARKSSLSQMDSPAGMNAPASAVSPRERAPSNPSKPLPFIRPADIYKRLEEERSRERTSMESSRPSLDSLSSRPVQDPASSGALKERESSESLGRSAEAGRSLQPLETVAERKSEYLPEFDVSSQRPQQDRRQPAETSEPVRSAVTTSQLPSLPPVQRISTFDDDFWLSSSQQRGSAKDIAATSPLDDGGLRSIVDQAFTRVDDGQSASPTPISKQEDSGISRSNTDSTVSISPIMSRVPSSAVSALKTRNAEGQSNTPVIVEETSGTDTPVIQERLGNSHQIPRKPSPSHSRNISSTSISQAGLTPSPHDSPARSPAIEPRKPLPEPESALVDTFSALSPESVDAGLPGPSSAYTIREADIASEIRASPDKALELGIAEKESRNSFLESHPSPPAQLAEAAPRSRSESPSKGRVHELANKFGHVSHSRRGSTQSNASRSSVQSWERSQENSRPSSPVKIEADRSVRPVGDLQGERPPAAHELSFRPKLPGQWESFATSVPTPSDQGDKDVQLGNGSERASEQVQEPSPLNEVDLTPTTAKRPVATSDPMEPSPEPSSDPIAAVKAAGSAIGDAIKASVGLDVPGHTDQSYSVGDVYLPPLKLDRTASSVASSAPPTPPAKDTPLSEFPPPPPLKTRSPEPASSSNQQQTPTRPTVLPQLSTEPSIHDQESDRLRKEIVASLSPLRTSEAAHLRSPSGSLQPLQPGAANRESSILPSEYDSYWADEDPYPHQSNDPEQKAVDFPVTNLSQAPLTAPAAQPSTGPQSILPTRFSWEDHQGSVSVASEPPAQSIAQAPTVTKGEPETGTLMVNKDQEESKQGTPVEAERTPRPSPTPPPASLKDEASAAQAETAKPKTPVHHEGLHVVNTEVDPEAVDLPARLNPEVREAVQRQQEQPSTPSVSNQIEVQQVDASGVLGPTNIQHNTSVSLTSDEKPLGFREITAITSTPERIATFNRTREQWATADQGLQEWIASALTANPSLASQPLTAPQMPLSAASRHKTGPSLSLFGKHHTSSHVQSQGTPQDQYSASPVTATPSLSASAAHAQTYNLSVSSSGGRSASAKGKDLLHTAGVLGGKGMTSAKGLFAKGKSRFRASGSGDKVDH
ncbi:hypothetical protein GQ43DRAFT_317255 [Delitschia confertaspora ATCC 74209]|uniref:Uncharacterized protein n=1 Tax=Delitschia confertaspora ATCC 74209 TaxID=1513339 RepID=A0A9P4MWJ2_9PLEO|nr:hypothetical protein GQ43DRAFT_317255 [Delitschia confertaspora ATCC 74209]